MIHSNLNGQLQVEDCLVDDIVNRFGTPVYIYSKAMLAEAYQRYANTLNNPKHRVFFAVKANGNLSILSLFAQLGSGFDIVSGGELARVLAAGGDPGRVVFSGVGKTAAEIEMALRAGIACFNVESADELYRIDEIAQTLGKIAPIALRVNPDVDPKTHPYISTGMEKNKFGLDLERAYALYDECKTLNHLAIKGISCHIGSQLTDLSPFLEAFDKLLHMVDQLADQGIELEHIDIGGGLGVRYRQEDHPPAIDDLVKAILDRFKDRPQALWLEPGRSLVGNAGILATRVEYVKTTPKKRFAVVDAAMNDLMRPSLYQAWHDICPTNPAQSDAILCDVVGPVCESADTFGTDRTLTLSAGQNLAILTAGAYGESMASNYNCRPRPASVMVDKNQLTLIKRRETLEDLMASEKLD